MTLQRRLLLLLLVGAPLVWTAGLLFDRARARHEIDELFDVQQLRLAQQVLALLPAAAPAGAAPGEGAPGTAVPGGGTQAGGAPALRTAPARNPAERGDQLVIAAWTAAGEPLLVSADGSRLPFLAGAGGFVDQRIDGRDWRTYYLAGGGRVVAVAHRVHERRELVNALVAGQLVPWLLTLPVLLLVMAAAVRTALAPLRRLTAGLGQRNPADLRPLPEDALPADLRPLVHAINALLERVERGLAQERRFTADAAHELRTPLAALQAQWDAARAAAQAAGATPTAAEAGIGAGLERLSRLVAQMLALARIDRPDAKAVPAPLDWPALTEELFSALLPLAEARHVELACDWPPDGRPPWPAAGDAGLLQVMLRNLLDNAIRHAPAHSTVSLRLGTDSIEVADAGAGVPEADRHRLGDRFYRAPGQDDAGSGLGLSIVQRIAQLHAMRLRFIHGDGLRARLEPAGPEGG